MPRDVHISDRQGVPVSPSLFSTRFSIVLLAVILFGALLATTAQAQLLPEVDTAQRDDVVPEDDAGGASGPVDDGSAGLDPEVDTAQRDDVVPEDDAGGASGAVGGRSVTLDPNYDTAQRDDIVADDDGGGGASGAVDNRNEGFDPDYDTAQRDDVVEEEDTGVASGAVTDGVEPPQGVDTAERDDVVEDDPAGARGSSTTAPVPTGLRVTSDTDDSVSLSWTAVTNAAAYKVEYKKSSSSTWLHASYVYSGATATVDDLDCNAGYDFQVKARGDGIPYSYSYSDGSDSVSETTDRCNAPAPTGLRVTSDTDDSVSLSWRAVTDAAVYKIEYKRSSSSNWLHADYVFSGTTETIDELDCDTGYDFRVRARGDGSPYSYLYGDASDSVSETTDGCVAPAPTGLRVTSDTDDSVSLSWTPVNHAAMYKVEYKRSTSSNWLHATYESGTTATVDGLNSNTGYDFRVRARGDGVPYSYTYSDPSSTVSETTDLPDVDPPTGLRVTSDTEDSVSLRWNSATGAALYKVEYKRSSSSRWLHATYTSGTTTTVDDLRDNTGYDFRVRARGNGSTHSTTYSDPSSPVSETTDVPVIDAPTGLRVTSDTDDSVSLSWTSVDHAAMYKVEYKRSTSSRWLHATYTSGTTATVDDLDGNADYDFRVRARGDGAPYSTVYSDPSVSVSETTDVRVLLPPTGLTLSIEPNDANDLDLAFTRSSESTHYYQFELHRSDTRYGTYSAVGFPVADATSPADFDNKDQGYWYRARGRNCDTFIRTGCHGWSSWSDSIWVPDPAWTAFAFTPGPLALGGTSNVWTVPSRANGVYLDVDFAEGAAKNTAVGKIHVDVLDANDVVLSTREVDAEEDSISLTQRLGVSTGSRLRVTVNNNAFDLSYSLVTLTFHSGIDGTGLALAQATVQKERQPSTPPTGSSTVDRAAGSVTLNWEAGPARLGARPHHYEVEIPNKSNPGTLLYVNRSVSDTTLAIDDARTRGLEGTHTAKVSHCNAAGGCSVALDIQFTLDPEVVLSPPPAPMGVSVSATGQSSAAVTWTSQNGVEDYEVNYGIPGTDMSKWPSTHIDGPSARCHRDGQPQSRQSRASERADVDGLKCGRPYQFRVRGEGDGVVYAEEPPGPWSGIVERSTSTCTEKAPAPSGLAAGGIALDTVRVHWYRQHADQVASHEIRYRVWNADDTTGDWSSSVAAAVIGSSEDVDGLVCNTRYQFAMRSRGDGTPYAAGWGPWTADENLEPARTRLCDPVQPNRPRITLGVDANGEDQVTVQWEEVAGAAKYEVEYRAGADGMPVTLDAVTGTSTDIPLSLLDCVTYEFRVRSYGNGTTHRADWSNLSEETDQPGACPIDPEDYKVSGIEVSDSGVVTWDPPTASVNGYRIHYVRYNLEQDDNADEGTVHVDPLPRRWPIPDYLHYFRYNIKITSKYEDVDGKTVTVEDSTVTEPWQAPSDAPLIHNNKPDSCRNAEPLGQDVYGEPDKVTGPENGNYKNTVNVQLHGKIDAFGTQLFVGCYFNATVITALPAVDIINLRNEIHVHRKSALGGLFTPPQDSHDNKSAPFTCPACQGGTWYGPAMEETFVVHPLGTRSVPHMRALSHVTFSVRDVDDYSVVVLSKHHVLHGALEGEDDTDSR